MSEVNPYHRRRPHERSVPRCKTETYKNSFFPSTSLMWNTLPDYVQELNSISAFKHYLTKEDSVVPHYYYYGKRKQQIIHCRLRNNMSELNEDLYKRHLRDSPVCACGQPKETSEHYLLHCQLFNNIRLVTIQNLQPDYITLNNLLYGNSSYSVEINIMIFSKVHDFIAASGRFI